MAEIAALAANVATISGGGATTAAADPSRQTIVISGVGAVSGFGWGVEALWQGLRSGATSIRPFQRFDPGPHRTHLAAEVPLPPVPPVPPMLPGGGRRHLSLADRFALAAAGEALAAAGLLPALAGRPLASPEEDEDGGSTAAIADEGAMGVYFGSSTGGMWEAEEFLQGLLGGPRRTLHALASQQVNGPGDAVARAFGVTGPVATISSACASGALALGAALAALRAGEVEVALAGGADSLCQLTYAGFNALRAVDEGPCRPFQPGRAGMSVGEGAAVLVLEPLARARARGVEPLAALAGAGATCDAHHMTAPDPAGGGAALAIAAALADAGLSPGEIDFVNAHATGTPLNDTAEWRALAQVFGGRAARLPVTATKAGVGHLLGSSGALEAVVTALSLARRELHPAAGCGAAVDPACPVALVAGRPLRLPEARAAVSTSLAFGGANAALVFTRPAAAAA